MRNIKRNEKNNKNVITVAQEKSQNETDSIVEGIMRKKLPKWVMYLKSHVKQDKHKKKKATCKHIREILLKITM